MTIIFLCLFLYSSYKIFLWYKENKETNNSQEEIKKVIEDNNIESNNNKYTFISLKELNPDTVAWLKVDGTNIDYPVVQKDNNQYYLIHSFNKKKNSAGWIFLDYRNDLNEMSKNTIIYGHARLDKSMFGTLKYTLDKKWYKNKDNQIIKLTLEDKELEFQTFSTYHIKTEDYYITTDFNNDDEFQLFIDTLIKRSSYNYKVDVSIDDYILTLSSCYKDNEKVVLHAKLIK